MSADVLVIGGGITGVGIARDAVLRGLSVILLEQGELGSGTSSKFHELLHSGARYAVSNSFDAHKYYQENLILKNIAKNSISDTGGLFLAFTDADLIHADKLVKACREALIPIEEQDVKKVISKEPKINKNLKRAFSVPDAYLDGSRFIAINKNSAENLGARFLTYHKVIGFEQKNKNITAIKTLNKKTGEKVLIECGFVINATGPWVGEIGKLASIKINMSLNKGSMIVFEEKLTKSILNRCRPPDDGDIFVPTKNYTIFGTTSEPAGNINNPEVEQKAVDYLIKEGSIMIPDLINYKIIKKFAGIRPLYESSHGHQTERKISRTFEILDHKNQGIENFISVVGGKFMLYRLMAEKAMDTVCEKLGRDNRCQTAQMKLT